jgi:hypothetical protein
VRLRGLQQPAHDAAASELWNDIRVHCCPVDGGYYFIITLQDKGF